MKRLFFAVALVVLSASAMAQSNLGVLFNAAMTAAMELTTGVVVTSDMAIEKALAKVCAEANKQVPRTITQDVRLDKFGAGPGRRLTYNFTIERDVDIAQFFRVMTPRLKEEACAKDGMKVFFQNKITVTYSYSNRNSAHIGQVNVTPRDCGQ